MTAAAWVMPQPKIGDTVLFSSDATSFVHPTVGWVINKSGDCTANLLIFAPFTGFVEKSGVHHRDDPALKDNLGWHDQGCWAFSEAQDTINKLEGMKTQLALAMSKMEGTRNGKAEAASK